MSFRVKPVDPTAVIRDPHTFRQLAAEGDAVPDNSFWRRRVLAGEVIVLEDTPTVVVAPVVAVAVLETETERDARRAAIQPVARAADVLANVVVQTAPVVGPASVEGGERPTPLDAEPLETRTTQPIGNAPVKPLTTRS